ncbi:cyclic nucleotide-binding protein [Chitinophagaceae bacterium IBVUCB1]|nr:cyclic nucleotide-binding protein [Chitinophagaceae bacterium IBVUCB1]
MKDLEQYIQHYFDARAEDLSAIASAFSYKAIHKSDYLLKEGRICTQLSFIKQGLVRIYSTQNDKEVTQWISISGYFVTELSSFIFNTPARWNIQALTDCELYTIDKDQYEKLGLQIPEWHKLEKLFIAKCFIILEERVNSFLFMTAEERYNQLLSINPELFNQVPLQYLASMLGMTPETLSRLRKKAIG